MTWAGLKELSLQQNHEAILKDPRLLTTLKTSCVLCGRISSRPRGFQQHLQQDHQQILEGSKGIEDGHVNEAAASCRLCKCGNAYSKRGHACVIYTQLAALRYAHSLQEEPIPVKPTTTAPPLTKEASQV